MSFSLTSAEPDLDVNDPEFWKKMMPEQIDKPSTDIVYEPRSRKQTKRFEFDAKRTSIIVIRR